MRITMRVKVFPSGPLATNAYVLSEEGCNLATVIDPAFESLEPICSYLSENKLTADKIILTHSHWDHFGDLAALKEKTGAKVYVHPLDQKNIEKPGSDGLPMFLPVASTTIDENLVENQEVIIANHPFTVIETPGHTPGGICLHSKELGILISGDTLFKGSIGNLSFPTASAEDMWKSLEKLSHLAPSTKVYPGHGEMTTIGAEDWLKNAKQIFS